MPSASNRPSMPPLQRSFTHTRYFTGSLVSRSPEELEPKATLTSPFPLFNNPFDYWDPSNSDQARPHRHSPSSPTSPDSSATTHPTTFLIDDQRSPTFHPLPLSTMASPFSTPSRHSATTIPSPPGAPRISRFREELADPAPEPTTPSMRLDRVLARDHAARTHAATTISPPRAAQLADRARRHTVPSPVPALDTPSPAPTPEDEAATLNAGLTALARRGRLRFTLPSPPPRAPLAEASEARVNARAAAPDDGTTTARPKSRAGAKRSSTDGDDGAAVPAPAAEDASSAQVGKRRKSGGKRDSGVAMEDEGARGHGRKGSKGLIRGLVGRMSL